MKFCAGGSRHSESLLVGVFFPNLVKGRSQISPLLHHTRAQGVQISYQPSDINNQEQRCPGSTRCDHNMHLTNASAVACAQMSVFGAHNNRCAVRGHDLRGQVCLRCTRHCCPAWIDTALPCDQVCCDCGPGVLGGFKCDGDLSCAERSVLAHRTHEPSQRHKGNLLPII